MRGLLCTLKLFANLPAERMNQIKLLKVTDCYGVIFSCRLHLDNPIIEGLLVTRLLEVYCMLAKLEMCEIKSTS